MEHTNQHIVTTHPTIHVTIDDADSDTIDIILSALAQERRRHLQIVHDRTWDRTNRRDSLKRARTLYSTIQTIKTAHATPTNIEEYLEELVDAS